MKNEIKEVFDVKKLKDSSFKAAIPDSLPEGLTGYMASGSISLPEIARQVISKPCANADLFMYMFRRFGYPNVGWDDYKDVAGYLLTTPMEGVYLSVFIRGGNTLDYSFAVRFTEKIENQLNEEEQLPVNQYRKRVYDWAKENCYIRKVPDKDQFFYERKDKWDIATDGEPSFDMIDPSSDADMDERTFYEQDAYMKAMDKMYKEENPDDKPARIYYSSLHWSEIPGIAGKVNVALATAISDLERFTSVQDSYFNIYGDMSEDDNPDVYNPLNEDGEYDPELEVYEHAGCAPQALFGNRNKKEKY